MYHLPSPNVPYICLILLVAGHGHRLFFTGIQPCPAVPYRFRWLSHITGSHSLFITVATVTRRHPPSFIVPDDAGGHLLLPTVPPIHPVFPTGQADGRPAYRP